MKISKALCLTLLLSGCATHIVRLGPVNTFYPARSEEHTSELQSQR